MEVESVLHGGYVLRSNRERIGLTQEQVVMMIDMPLRTYQRWETKQSEPSLSAVALICESVFKIKLSDAVQIAQGIYDEH